MATATKAKTVAKKAGSTKCCFKGCTQEGKARGLCPNHYGGAAALVAAGKTTWKELERLGASKPAVERGPGFGDFLKDLRAKNKAKAGGGKTKPAKAAKSVGHTIVEGNEGPEPAPAE